MLRLWSLDIIPYRLGPNGWSQPPGGLHRKSDLPLFILKDIPAKYYDAFSKALTIRSGKEELFVPNCSFHGDDFIKSVKKMYEKLEEKDKEKIKAKAKKFIATKTAPTYRYVYYAH